MELSIILIQKKLRERRWLFFTVTSLIFFKQKCDKQLRRFYNQNMHIEVLVYDKCINLGAGGIALHFNSRAKISNTQDIPAQIQRVKLHVWLLGSSVCMYGHWVVILFALKFKNHKVFSGRY